MFKKRPSAGGIVFTGTHVPGRAIKATVNEGDLVTLKVDEESVLVQDVKKDESGLYRGVIYGFEPSGALEYGGLQLEQEVKFEHQHIFGCARG